MSNDELDNEDDDSTEFLSAYQSSASSNYKQQKHRSLTPDRNDSHSSSSSLRKQRQNSSSRSNTLERKKYDNKSLSASRSSSSSSSYSGVGNNGPEGEFRRSQLISSKSSDDQRIRRSRSLQLNERSPNQVHKQKQSAGPPPLPNRNSSYNSKPPRHPQPPTQSQNRGFRSSEVDKSRSFDLDYGTSGFTTNYNNNTNYTSNRSDLDKSRSFDEDYRDPSGTSSGGSGRYLKANSTEVSKTRKSSPRQQTSPQNYGTRLCDHELTYDMVRRNLDRHGKMRNSETINAGGNSELNFMNSDRIYDHPTTIPLKGDNDSLTPDSSNEYKSITTAPVRQKNPVAGATTTTTSSSSLSSINTGHRGTSTSRGSCIVSCDNKEFDENCKRTPNPNNNNIFVYWKSGISEKELKPREKAI
uniref:Uncharacterized protein n=1 Tax=Megaselia scalaris TaxID=36166 RepID=T1GEK8_MEGSC